MEKGETMRETISRIKWLIILSIMVIFPILVFAGMSIPAADDFSNAKDVLYNWRVMHGSAFSAALAETRANYLSIGGYYSSLFINFFFTPLAYGVPALRLFNIIANSLFFFLLFLLIFVFTKYVLKQDVGIAWLIYALYTFILVNGYSNNEIYTWYTGIVAYVLPVTSVFLTLTLMILGSTKSEKYFIPASFMALWASGSPLNVVALNCGLIFIYCIYSFFTFGKKKSGIIVFIMALLGGVINLIAPGNFKRHDMGGTEYNIAKALSVDFNTTRDMFLFRINQSPLLIVLVIILLAAIIHVDYKQRKISYEHPLLMLLVVFVGVLIVNFPVALGTRGIGAPRVVFVQDVTIYTLLFAWIFYLGGFLKTKFGDFSFTKEHIAIISMCMLVSSAIMITTHGGVRTYPTGSMIASIFHGDLSNYVAYEESILDQVQYYDGDDVSIEIPRMKCIDCYKTMGVEEGNDNWINKSVAEFYKKKKVTIKYIEDKEE